MKLSPVLQDSPTMQLTLHSAHVLVYGLVLWRQYVESQSAKFMKTPNIFANQLQPRTTYMPRCT